MEKEIIKLLKEKGIGKRVAVMEKIYGVYIWRKKLYVVINFADQEFQGASKEHQEEVFKLVQANKYEFSNTYQGQP